MGVVLFLVLFIYRWLFVLFACLCRLCFDRAAQWSSFQSLEEVGHTVVAVIKQIFQRLETNHGQVLVSHALGYLTLAKKGLSAGQMEDVLSLDDEVLNDVFEWWLPPVRRIPPLLWTRIMSDLGAYLVERGNRGVVVYSWFHRQFW